MPQNCYAYAVGHPDRVDPGNFAGVQYLSNSAQDLRAAAEADGLTWAGNAVLPPASPGHYIVACISTTADTVNYHWIRQDFSSQGEWSHKPGKESVRYTDGPGNKLTGTNLPHTANWDLCHGLDPRLVPMARDSGFADYDIFVGYFYCPNGGLRMRRQKKCEIL